MQAVHAAQYQKNKQLNQKVDRRCKQTFLQRRHTDGQQTREKMLNILIIREIQTKTTNYNLTAVRMAVIKKIYKQ